jgi:hypothetical protein
MIAGWQVEMAARQAPQVRQIVPGSTPVVSFGDPLRADVVTVGINPSSAEFCRGGVLRTGPQRRLATMDSIGAEPGRPLSPDQARTIVADCNTYFARNPYRTWFDPLDRILRIAVGASYYAGTACHLDLVQWATVQVWGQLHDPPAARLLIEEGRQHLRRLLEASGVRLVLLNGISVVKQVTAAELCRLHEVQEITLEQTTYKLYLGRSEVATYIGWSANPQGNRKTTPRFLEPLATAVRALLDDRFVRHTPPVRPLIAQATPTDDRRYLPHGMELASKRELAEVLGAWLRDSDASTIGDIAGYGRRKWITVRLDGLRAELNADTTRAAVARYLEQVRRDGPELPWRVVPTTRAHVIRKIVFSDDPDITGWNCYLSKPLAEPRTL